MRYVWTVVKVALALALILPLGIIALTMAVGVFGALFGLAIVVLRLAVVGLLAYGALRLIVRLARGPSVPQPQPRQIADAPRVDPYYEQAIRELDRDIGPVR